MALGKAALPGCLAIRSTRIQVFLGGKASKGHPLAPLAPSLVLGTSLELPWTRSPWGAAPREAPVVLLALRILPRTQNERAELLSASK